MNSYCKSFTLIAKKKTSCGRKYFGKILQLFHPVISLSNLFLKCIYVTFSFGFSSSFSFNFSFSLISNLDEHTHRIISLEQIEPVLFPQTVITL